MDNSHHWRLIACTTSICIHRTPLPRRTTLRGGGRGGGVPSRGCGKGIAFSPRSRCQGTCAASGGRSCGSPTTRRATGVPPLSRARRRPTEIVTDDIMSSLIISAGRLRNRGLCNSCLSAFVGCCGGLLEAFCSATIRTIRRLSGRVRPHGAALSPSTDGTRTSGADGPARAGVGCQPVGMRHPVGMVEARGSTARLAFSNQTSEKKTPPGAEGCNESFP